MALLALLCSHVSSTLSDLFKYFEVHNKTIFIPCHTRLLGSCNCFILNTTTTFALSVIYVYATSLAIIGSQICPVSYPDFSSTHRYFISIVYFSETEWLPQWFCVPSENLFKFRVSRLVQNALPRLV